MCCLCCFNSLPLSGQEHYYLIWSEIQTGNTIGTIQCNVKITHRSQQINSTSTPAPEYKAMLGEGRRGVQSGDFLNNTWPQRPSFWPQTEVKAPLSPRHLATKADPSAVFPPWVPACLAGWREMPTQLHSPAMTSPSRRWRKDPVSHQQHPNTESHSQWIINQYAIPTLPSLIWNAYLR